MAATDCSSLLCSSHYQRVDSVALLRELGWHACAQTLAINSKYCLSICGSLLKEHNETLRRLMAWLRLFGIDMSSERKGNGISQFPLSFLWIPRSMISIKRWSSHETLTSLSSLVQKMLYPFSFLLWCSLYSPLILKLFVQGMVSYKVRSFLELWVALLQCHNINGSTYSIWTDLARYCPS